MTAAKSFAAGDRTVELLIHKQAYKSLSHPAPFCQLMTNILLTDNMSVKDSNQLHGPNQNNLFKLKEGFHLAINQLPTNSELK